MDDFISVEPYANVLNECLSQKVQSANALSNEKP